ncbi:hypothetical protein EH240_19730 [Mesorhizobium tamadayense]|uniref:Uncharacterized protein n=1 Tax=Mesorhizobium tamadayense TaxID=425306 RepID=A0A3P3FHD6_9HYPH|nr:hypothetical protein [Mesorhizobium tamadayense]RRH98033.1 hypothetical protein EH240_19730 [Mesorhizobium tamadayense]
MNNADLAILGGMTILVLVGIYLVVRRILIAVQRRRPKPNAYLSEYSSVPIEEAPWDWEGPVDLATEPASSQAAVPSDTADRDVRPQHANYRQFGVRIEHFDILSEILSEACENSPGGLPDAVASTTNIATASPPRVRRPIGLVSRLGLATICLAVPLGYAMTRQNWVESAPASSQAQDHPDLSASAALDMRGQARGDARTGVELLNPDLTATKAQVEAALAQAAAARELAGQEHREVEGERARNASLQSALLESRKQIDALRASMAAADKAREERLRNELAAARTLDAMRRVAGDARAVLGETINYVFTQLPAAHLERQRTERMARDLSQARAQIEQLEAKAAEDRAKAEASLAQASGMLDEERRKSEDLRGDLAEIQQSRAAAADTTERERTGAATARARADQTAAETAQALARERAATASIREDLNKARIERDAAEQERTKAVSARDHADQTAAETAQALVRERAATASIREDLNKARLERDAAEQERAKAVSARDRAEQTAAETAQALARERAATASARGDFNRARIERDAAEQERTKAVSARDRVEQTAAETAQALARERAATASTQEDLNKARLERDEARELLGQASEALDKQREATVSLARDLAAARADNDQLRADRRSAQIEPPLKPRTGRASAGTGQVKAVSQKTTRSKVRNPSRVTRVRSITLPFSLQPSHSTLD